jgi:hypothetical protein
MKILAIEKEIPGIAPEDFNPHLRAEALKIWELNQAGILREIYFRQDRSDAVLVLECNSAAEAVEILNMLPLVRHKLITFEIIPLIPYPGLSRLFVPE